MYCSVELATLGWNPEVVRPGYLWLCMGDGEIDFLEACGNGYCRPGINDSNAYCDDPSSPRGEGVCGENETAESCPEDCADSYCGDGVC